MHNIIGTIGDKNSEAYRILLMASFWDMCLLLHDEINENIHCPALVYPYHVKGSAQTIL
jgi:hypothetical protein